ncbi:MAG: hypothetical protein LLF98_02675 [Clostridium sp.]|uniref:hypothetical protein n=1 Tax=Clostridium sp. TaxID=1506 RepID=UPI0025C21BF0|nr:hypothetical protein [Clostridium sp.]MCE5220188.1 hypothetical protein [Clostridium sp.]
MKYYFASMEDFNNVELKPRIPIDRMKIENDYTERICVSQSIVGCLTALRKFDLNDIVYIYECESNNVYQPTTEEVPDVCFTGEEWILEPVTMKYFMTIIIVNKKWFKINNMDLAVYEFN